MKSFRARKKAGFGRIGLLSLGSLVLLAALAWGQSANPKPKAGIGEKKPVTSNAATYTFEKDVKPKIDKYCVACHGATNPMAGLSLAKFKTQTSMQDAGEVWTKVAKNIKSGHMPPKGLPAPPKAERDRLVLAIETLVKDSCALTEPGRVTMRRLNRAEYDNTIRDLTGVDFRPAEDFPSDDVGYGFDNIGDVLALSPLLFEKYLNAAEQVAARAIPIRVRLNQTVAGPELLLEGSAALADPGVLLLSNGGRVRTSVAIPLPGVYKLRAKVAAQQAGGELARLRVSFGTQVLAERDVKGTPAEPETWEFSHQAKEATKADLTVEFLNDFYDASRPEGQRDRNGIVYSLQVEGPVQGQVATAVHPILGAPPAPGQERLAARAALTKFATRAFRRPATATEVDRLMTLFDMSQKAKEPYEMGIRLGVTAILVSPNFLFRVEADPKSGQRERVLNDYELATRLSYFLWSSTPDNTLLALAGQGKLRDPAVLIAQAKRMVADPKSRALADNFAEQWLQLRMLPTFEPNLKQFPGWNDGLRTAMLTETKMFFDHVLRTDGNVIDFLDGRYTFVNGPLAKHYGIPGVTGDKFVRVALADPNRAGLMTHASILSLTSNPTRTSPTKRGKWVLEQILGTPPPPPPPGVGDLGDDENHAISAKSLRERMDLHRKKPDCFSCHSRMDPIGFGMENFDAVGRWRSQEGGAKVDATGVLPDGTKFSGPAELRAVLMKNKHPFAETLTEKLLTYALGRGLDLNDRCIVEEVAQDAAANGYRFSRIVTGIVTSDPFRKRTLASTAPPPRKP